MIVTKVLPGTRSAIVIILIDNYNVKQTEISEALGISQSSVSHYYTTSARASDEYIYSVFPEIIKFAKTVTDKIVKNQIRSYEISFCEPCKIIRENKQFLNFHR